MFFYKLFLLEVQFYAFGFCRSLRQCPGKAHDPFAVFLLLECGNKSFLLDAFYKGVWKEPFGTVPDFYTAPAVFQVHKNEDAFIALSAHTPAFGGLHGEGAVIRMAYVVQQGTGHGNTCFSVKFFGQCVEKFYFLVGHHVDFVVDITVCRSRRNVLCRGKNI